MVDATTRVWTVYRYYDADGQLLYVGMTGHGHGRSHRHSRNADWWPLIARGEFEHYATPVEAARREDELITSLAPSYNKSGNPNWEPPDRPRKTARQGLGATTQAIRAELSQLGSVELTELGDEGVAERVWRNHGLSTSAGYVNKVRREQRTTPGYVNKVRRNGYGR